ncbi:1-deoxy-D-xylulose-5-phosphate synthase [Bacteroides salyersiae]|jgi:1-deoxy-D-xylulose-5-phosphate synthase|uniref:1-deoxy-D-xylulose-5-phosphate synthase n=1 Tax=Bacteroides salyersiae TaxID=291644 RepID=UPI00397CBC92
MKNETTYSLLNALDNPEDLRRLTPEQLPEVCHELRQDIIKEVSCNPGHFAASLGVVELTVALHYVFNTPYDRLVWDVGHQAYGHKILTGRRDTFSTNRKMGGIRPFPSPEESEYDTFTCGHASNSISAALGMAVAAMKKGERDRHVVAVIGDGSMSGGLAFEGLNNVSSTPNNLLIILNDNDMAIDRSVGGMKQYLFNLTTSNRYNQLRFKTSQLLFKMGILNEDRRKALIRLGNSLKSLVAQQQNIFEGMNIRYFGPVDGHDVQNIARILRDIKDMEGPKVLHLHTIKGKGFEPAEKHPGIWHAPGKFDPETGKRLIADTNGMPPLFQDVFGHTLVELAEQNPRIVGVTPAMPTGCSMNFLMEQMPGRAFDVGIAEGHAVTFSGGMAKDGLLPFCNIYSSFMQRAYDNVIHDVAIQRLPVVLCLDRAGLVGEDGPTHHGMFDLAYMRPIPNLTVSSPMNEHELRRLMYTAQLPDKGPFVIRYPRGRGVLVDWKCPLEEIPVGRGRKLKEGRDLAVITIGPIGNTAAHAIAQVEKENPKQSIAHYDLRFLKPLDEELLHEIGTRFNHIITIEDGIKAGGMGSAVLEFMADHGYSPKLQRIGIPDHFIEHGTAAQLYALCGLDEEGIKKVLKGEKWEKNARINGNGIKIQTVDEKAHLSN